MFLPLNNKINFFIRRNAGEAFFIIIWRRIKKIEDAQKLSNLDWKIILNSIVLDNIEIVKKYVDIIGSQSVVVSVDIIKEIIITLYLITETYPLNIEIRVFNKIKWL